MSAPTTVQKLAAEALGTFWLVLGGCGSAVFAAKVIADDDGTQLGIGFLGVSIAFGLTVLTGVYALGHISGGHFNPAVTVGAALARRFQWKDVPGYVVVQVIGGLIGGAIILLIANGKEGSRPRVRWPPTASATTRRAGTPCGPHSWPRSC
ncbi:MULTISPECIES: aquaporin [Actinomycetes]|uniref:aquaporin n=1 Tax=Actinomycetes TaxID=1760 RepID=UPI000A5014C3|nr:MULTISPECIES: aquaporin [Actinomycetes]